MFKHDFRIHLEQVMEFYVMARTYNVYGGDNTLSLIPGFLLRNAGDFGNAISELTVTLHFPHSGPPRKTLETSYAEFHQNRNRLPKVVFRRAREQVTIDVSSELMDGVNWKTGRVLSLAKFQSGVTEVLNALQLLRERLTAKDEFNLAAFLDHCQYRASRLPTTEEELLLLKEELDQLRKARLAAMSPWEKLGVEWRDFHPDARTILNDPLYWEDGNYFSPHGNDTGADLLADYRKWIKRNPAGDPIGFLEKHIKGWGYGEKVDQNVADEAAIALAFAELKMRAKCQAEVVAMALEAMQRQRQDAIEATSWPHREERLKRLMMLEGKLKEQSTRKS